MKRTGKQWAVDYIHGIARHLDHPVLVGMSRDSSNTHPPGLEMEKEENVVRDEATPGQDFHCEEINACQDRHMRTDEVCPGRLFATFGSRRDTEWCRMLPTV
jgi:hypothetical protein